MTVLVLTATLALLALEARRSFRLGNWIRGSLLAGGVGATMAILAQALA